MAKKKKDDQEAAVAPKVWPVVMIHKDNLHLDPTNTQKQSRKTFKELRANVREQGFDENLIVIPHPELPNDYIIKSGNHRFQAGCAEGMVEFPCVVRHDWDAVTAHLQSVRRNYARGALDKDAFTALIDQLQTEHQINVDEIQEGMGFGGDVDAFAELYSMEAVEKAEAEQVERTRTDAAAKVKLVDDLGLIISYILENHGESAPWSYLIFPSANKTHMFVQANNSLKKVMNQIAAVCVERQLDINVVLTGLLTLGANQTDFLKTKTPVVEEEGVRLEEAAEDTEFHLDID